MTTHDFDALRAERHHVTIADMAKRLEAAQGDVARMNWLVEHDVEVRDPRLHGSVHLFTAQTTSDEEDDFHRTSLREQIDAAMQESGEWTEWVG